MTPELSNTLAALAQKLGTSVERLWPIMVARARMSAYVDVFAGIAMIVVSIIVIRWSVNKYVENDGWDGLFPLYATAITVSVVAILLGTIFVFGSITGIFYPEIDAIKSLLK